MEVSKALLETSQVMFESIGVLQRDAPLSEYDAKKDAKALEAYKQLLNKYSILLQEKIAATYAAIDSVKVTGETCEQKTLNVQQQIPSLISEIKDRLSNRLVENIHKHEQLNALFEELVQGRYA